MSSLLSHFEHVWNNPDEGLETAESEHDTVGPHGLMLGVNKLQIINIQHMVAHCDGASYSNNLNMSILTKRCGQFVIS